MRALRIPVATLFGLVFAFVAVNVVAPEWSRKVGLDVWNFPALQAEMRQASAERASMSARADLMARQRQAANQIAWNVADGLPLSEAADELLEVYKGEPDMIMWLGLRYPGLPTPRHLFARHAIDRVKQIVTDPARRDAVVARLEAEYRALDASPEAPSPSAGHSLRE